MLAPTVDCGTGLLTFRTSGGDGTLIEYFAVGLKPWGTTTTATLESWLPDGVVFTLQARQSGKVVSRDYTTNCKALPVIAPVVVTPVIVNKAPVLVTAIGSQTATLARAYSFVIPIGTFTDPDGQLVSWSVSGLPVGLSFDANSRTISGVPSLIGAGVVTVTVTDNGGATAQTSFTLQVLGNNTPTPPTTTTVTTPPTTTTVTTPPAPTALTMVAPTVDCGTGLLTFRTSGGDGSPIEYFAVGLKPWGSTTTATLESWLPDGVVFTLQARQSGKVVSRDYTTNCKALPVIAPVMVTPVIVNKAPVLVTAIGSQTATLARAYSFVIPVGTFTDPDGQLVSWSVSGLPVGLSFEASSRTISGTPSLIGAGVVTVTVTDNGGATAQTSFTLQVLGNNTPTPPTPLPPALTLPDPVTITTPPTTTVTTPPAPTALTMLAPTVDCGTGLFTFRTSGGDGTPVEYFAVGLKPWSTTPTAKLESWLSDGVVFTLQARQSGKVVSQDYTTNCKTAATPVTTPVAANKPPVLVTAIGSQTATLARAYSLVIPAGTFTDPDGQVVSWAVSGLPVGLSFEASSRTISGVPSLIGAGVVTVTVTDNGGATAQTSFTLQVLGNNTPTVTSTIANTIAAPTTAPTALTMLAPTVDCGTGLLTFRSSGGDGSPIEYFAVGLKPWGSTITAYIETWMRVGVTFTLQARQSGKVVSIDYTTNCTGPSGSRIAAPETGAEVAGWVVSPNPFEQELSISIPEIVKPDQLRIGLSNISGISQDGAIESTRIDGGKLYVRLPKLQSGFYLLRITNGDQPLQTLKVLKR